jgi:RES domain-containing protein
LAASSDRSIPEALDMDPWMVGGLSPTRPWPRLLNGRGWGLTIEDERLAISAPVHPDVRLAAVSLDAWTTGPIRATPFDVSELVTSDGNRWSLTAQPTLYLASDPGVALAETGRHWGRTIGDIALWSVRVTLDAVADLRRRDQWSSLTIPADPCWMLDRERCRGIASRLRADGDADGLIVPSAALLDDPSRYDIVVFVERLRRDVSLAVELCRMEQVLRATR